MGREIRIEPQGRLGNHMFQYMMAAVIQQQVPDSRISGLGGSVYCNNVMRWDLPLADPDPDELENFDIWGHLVSIDDAVRHLLSGSDRRVTIKSVSGRYSYYCDHLDLFRKLFAKDFSIPSQCYGDDHIVINIRLGDALVGIHPLYPVLPIAWYEEIVTETGKIPVFVGQLGEDPVTAELKRRFPNATFIANRDPFHDFEAVRRARHVVLSVSTFSWLAAWLSTSIDTIHFPIAGIFDRRNRRDLDMTPRADARYQRYLFPQHSWSGSPDDVEAVVNGASNCVKVDDAGAQKAMGDMLPGNSPVQGI